VVLERFVGLLLRRFAQTLNNENGLFSVGSNADADLIPGGATQLFAIVVKRLICPSEAVKRLVKPNLAGQQNTVLRAFQGQKHLMQPILGRADRVFIVPGVRRKADMAKEILTVFHPLADGNTMIFKDRPCSWKKGSAAGTLVPLDAAFRESALLEEKGLTFTVGAFGRNKRVDHFRLAAVSDRAMAIVIVLLVVLLQKSLHRGQFLQRIPRGGFP